MRLRNEAVETIGAPSVERSSKRDDRLIEKGTKAVLFDNTDRTPPPGLVRPVPPQKGASPSSPAGLRIKELSPSKGR